MAAQAGTLYYVSEIVEDDGGVDCDASPYYLQLIALLLYSNLIWVDIFETIKLTSYLFWIPTVASWTDLNVFVADFKGTPVAFAAGHGMTSWYRWTCIVMIILPKLAMACGLWWIGASFLLASPTTTDLLLNMVALAFVLEIDDYLYNGMVPDFVKETAVELFPEFRMMHDDVEKSSFEITLMCYSVFGSYIIPGIVFGMAFGIHGHYC